MDATWIKAVANGFPPQASWSIVVPPERVANTIAGQLRRIIFMCAIAIDYQVKFPCYF
jgi:hypothetical protein